VRLNLRAPGLVVVTGAGSGIGRATALELAKDRGTTVLVTDIDELTARETVDLVRAKSGRADAYRLDVSDADAWEAFAAMVVQTYGVPDVLVNNAGMVVGGSFLDHSAEDWERQLGVNLFGVVHGCRVFGKQMVARGRGGHIVNIASAAAYTPVAMMPAYCVSKAGVKMLSECLRAELAPHRIGVTAICPGFINTNIDRHGVIVGVDDDVVADGRNALERLRAVGDRLPVRIAQPAEVARAVRAAVRLDLAVVPVRPEAWLGYVLSRVSPGLVRSTSRPFDAARLQRVVGLLPQRLRNPVGAESPPVTKTTEAAVR
jgi:NAD(P)-dependent dehydrogenase (short-subunit alcohol dehydrogenase family)